MKKERASVTVGLSIGYEDKEGNRHTVVEIARPVKAIDLIAAHAAWNGQDTVLNTLILRHAITRFGSLPIPVEIGTLLELALIDFDDLVAAYNDFYMQYGEAQPTNDETLTLFFGLPFEGDVYDVIEFGSKVRGLDEAEAEKKGYIGLVKASYLAARSVLKLRQSEGDKVLDGPLVLAHLTEMDGMDLLNMIASSESYRRSIKYIAKVTGQSEAETLERLKKKRSTDQHVSESTGHLNS